MTKIVQSNILNIFLPISFDICFRCSKDRSQRDGSFSVPATNVLVEKLEKKM